MACHHCGKARRAVVQAAKAAVKGDTEVAKAAVKDVFESVKAKVADHKATK
jgi:hypothetical protein